MILCPFPSNSIIKYIGKLIEKEKSIKVKIKKDKIKACEFISYVCGLTPHKVVQLVRFGN